MKTKHVRRHKMLISLVALFTTLMCVCVGFASWIVTSGSNALAMGEIDTDDFVDKTHIDYLDVVEITSLDKIESAQGYGFVRDGVFGSSAVLNGTCSFDSTVAQQCIPTFRNNKSFKLDVVISCTLTDGLSANGFTSSSISLASDNFTVAAQDPTDSETITTTFVITCTDNASDFDFDFSITLNYGNSLSNFPKLSTAGFNILFQPKENS